jgi:hypothetical protein
VHTRACPLKNNSPGEIHQLGSLELHRQIASVYQHLGIITFAKCRSLYAQQREYEVLIMHSILSSVSEGAACVWRWQSTVTAYMHPIDALQARRRLALLFVKSVLC